MRAGQLRDRIEIQRGEAEADAAGQRNLTWKTLYRRWAAVEQQAGGETVSSDQHVRKASYLVRVRHSADLSTNHRVRWRNKTLEIRSIVDPDGRRRELHLTCAELLTT